MKYLLLIAMVLIPALANAQSLINPTIVHPTFSQGINVNSSNGMQIICMSGCSTTAVVGNTCLNTFVWPTPFNDTAYNTFCQPANGITGEPVLGVAWGPSPTGESVYTMTIGAVISSFTTICCLGIHS